MAEEKKLNLGQLIWIATGQVVGAGVVTIVGSALAVTGYSAWFAYTAACLMGLFRVIPQIFFYSSVVAPGGTYGLITRCCGMKYGGMITLASLIGWVARGTAVLSIGNYLNAMFPSVSKLAFAFIVVTFLTIANLFGVDVMAKIQSLATPTLLVCLMVFSVICAFNVQEGYTDFNSPEMFTNGFSGWLSAVVLLNYSTTGHALVGNFATRCENPKKNIPLTILITTGIIAVLYTSVGFASGAVLPLSETAGGTLTKTAKYILPAWGYYVFMFGGPVFALLTTMNSGILNSALPVLAGVKEGWLPEFLAKKNKHGAYYVAILAIYVISLIPVSTGMSVSQITNTTLIISGFSSCLMLFAGYSFPKKFPKEWKESWLHIPDGVYYVLITLSAFVQAFVIYKSVADLSLQLALINIAVVAVAVGYGIYRMKTATIKEVTDV